jgi:hypothetical protein
LFSSSQLSCCTSTGRSLRLGSRRSSRRRHRVRVALYPSGAILPLQREPVWPIRVVPVCKPVRQPVLPVSSPSWRLQMDRKSRPLR